MTAAIAAAPSGRKLSLSRVLEQIVGVLKLEFGADYALAVGIAALPMVLNVVVVQGGLRAAQAQRLPGLHGMFGPSFWGVSVLSLLASLLIYAALSWGAAERMQARAPTLGERLTVGLQALPVLIGVAVLAYLALVLATLLLFVPALFLATCWSVVVPVVMMEKLGVIGGLGRSFELTRGNRWTIFLLLLLYWVVSLVIVLVGGVIVRAVFGVGGGLFATTPASGVALWAGFVVNLLVGGVVNVVGAVGVGVVYSELRGSQGGFDARRLGEVFA